MPRVFATCLVAMLAAHCSGESTDDRKSANGKTQQGNGNLGMTNQFVFTWNRPASAQDLVEYQIDYSIGNAPMAKLFSVKVDDVGFNLQQPLLIIRQDQQAELQAPPGTNFCFELIARSTSGDSQPSASACGSI